MDFCFGILRGTSCLGKWLSFSMGGCSICFRWCRWHCWSACWSCFWSRGSLPSSYRALVWDRYWGRITWKGFRPRWLSSSRFCWVSLLNFASRIQRIMACWIEGRSCLTFRLGRFSWFGNKRDLFSFWRYWETKSRISPWIEYFWAPLLPWVEWRLMETS
jgi:hypothetical protein